MKKTIILSMCGLLLMAGSAYAVGSLNLRGDYNGWGTTALSVSNSVWRLTIQETATAGARLFKFDEDGSWAYNWGAGAAVSDATETTLYWSGADGSYDSVSGNYYTFTVWDMARGANSTMMIQKTTNSPVTFSKSGEESGGMYNPNQSNTITLTLSSGTHAEDLYVRYTTDGWGSSSFVQATGAGTTMTTSIPAQARGTTVVYYGMSTTVGTPTHANADLETIAYSDGTNNSYTVADLGNCWHNRTEQVPGAGAGTTYLNGGLGGSGYIFYGTETTAYVYSGSQDLGAGDPADQSALTVYYRKVGDVTWSSSGGTYQHPNGNDVFWMASFDLSGFSDGDDIQYYLRLDYNDAETTYVYDSGRASQITYFESEATGSPAAFDFGDPTLVDLASFDAIWEEATVAVRWETLSEIDTEGFHLWRSETEEGTYSKINPEMILSEGSAIHGAVYEFSDLDVQSGLTYWYKLEDLDIYGVSTFHGPVEAVPVALCGSTVRGPAGMSWALLLAVLAVPLAIVGMMRRRIG